MIRIKLLIFPILLILTGCGSSSSDVLSQEKKVSQQLNQQLSQWTGTPYLYGGNNRQGIDCSAFVQKTFTQQFNISLPRTTKQQAKLGKKISINHLKSGDLVFFKVSLTTLHVGIYDKNNEFIHASVSNGVTRSSLKNTYWSKRYWQARRI